MKLTGVMLFSVHYESVLCQENEQIHSSETALFCKIVYENVGESITPARYNVLTLCNEIATGLYNSGELCNCCLVIVG